MRQTIRGGDQAPSPRKFWGTSHPNFTPVSEHHNQAEHSINEVLLIPLELIRSKRDSIRKARKAHPIDKDMTLEPRGINRRGELNFLVTFIFLVAYHFIRMLCIQISHI